MRLKFRNLLCTKMFQYNLFGKEEINRGDLYALLKNRK